MVRRLHFPRGREIHGLLPSVRFDEVSNIASLQINLNSVIHLDEGIRVADGVSIVGHQMRDSFCSHKDLSHFAQLILGLLWCNMMNSRATPGFIGETKILSSLVNADDIYKTSRVGYISVDIAINLNETLHADLLYFISC